MRSKRGGSWRAVVVGLVGFSIWCLRPGHGQPQKEAACLRYPADVDEECDGSTTETTPFNCQDKPVIVVGAGIAGSAAAYELKRLGCRVRVLEAAEIAGGRTRVRNDSPFPFLWIHGTENNPITSALRKFGFGDHIQYSGGDSQFPAKDDAIWYIPKKKRKRVKFVPRDDIQEGYRNIDRYLDKQFKDRDEYFGGRVGDGGTTETDIPVAYGEVVGLRVKEFLSTLDEYQRRILEFNLGGVYDEDWGLSRSEWSYNMGDPWLVPIHISCTLLSLARSQYYL